MANIYCENYNCKNYFEDMCMLERIEINNFKECESYLEGKNELYELENGYTIRSTNSILKNKNKCLEALEEELTKINSHLELEDLR